MGGTFRDEKKSVTVHLEKLQKAKEKKSEGSPLKDEPAPIEAKPCQRPPAPHPKNSLGDRCASEGGNPDASGGRKELDQGAQIFPRSGNPKRPNLSLKEPKGRGGSMNARGRKSQKNKNSRNLGNGGSTEPKRRFSRKGDQMD